MKRQKRKTSPPTVIRIFACLAIFVVLFHHQSGYGHVPLVVQDEEDSIWNLILPPQGPCLCFFYRGQSDQRAVSRSNPFPILFSPLLRLEPPAARARILTDDGTGQRKLPSRQKSLSPLGDWFFSFVFSYYLTSDYLTNERSKTPIEPSVEATNKRLPEMDD